MRKGSIWAIIFGVALLALIGWRVSTNNKADKAAMGGGAAGGGGGRGGAGGSRGPASVEVASVKPAQIIQSVDVVGNVESPHSVDLTPKITGRIDYLQVREGDEVKAGQVLVRIDPSDLNQQIIQQQANVAEAKAKLAQAMISQSSTTVGVTTNIDQQQASVMSSQADYNQAVQTYAALVQTAQSNVTDNEAKVRSANVQVTNAQSLLSQQQSNLKNAQTKAQRLETLFKQGAISQQDRDDAVTAVEVQQQNVNVAQGQVASAQAGVDSAQASLVGAKNGLEIAQKQGRASVTSSKAKLAQAQAGLRAANANKSQTPAYQASVDALQSAVAAAQAQLDAARVHLTDTKLISPINGPVTARSADPGNLASPGKSILTIQDLSSVNVTTSVPVEEAAGVREGMMAQVTIDSLPGQIFTGPIINMNPSADPQSRQFGIRIRLSNPGEILKPGMFAKVAIITQSVNAKTSVPTEAIEKDDSGASTVTVVDKDSVAHVVPVEVGVTDGKTVEVKRGVRPGDTVVILSYSRVQDGQEVSLPGSKDKGSSGGADGKSKSGSSGGRRKRSS